MEHLWCLPSLSLPLQKQTTLILIPGYTWLCPDIPRSWAAWVATGWTRDRPGAWVAAYFGRLGGENLDFLFFIFFKERKN
jgi:hypothetical protein